MKMNRVRAAMLLTAAVTVMGLTACGNSGTISSLTDSDSTASIAEGAAQDTTSVLTGSISAAESVVSSVAEIAPQTVAATEITSAPAAGTSSDSTAAEPEVTVSLTGDGTTASSATTTAAPAATAAPEADAEGDTIVGTPDSELPLLSDNQEVQEEEESYEPAGEGNTGVVTGDEVNVRSTPETGDDDNVMFTLFEGDVVRIIASEDGWYKIEVDGEIGWINASYVD